MGVDTRRVSSRMLGPEGGGGSHIDWREKRVSA